jgi:hypothetical protein
MLWRARLIHPLPTAPLVLEGTRRRGQGVNKSGANRETSNCPLNRGRSREGNTYASTDTSPCMFRFAGQGWFCLSFCLARCGSSGFPWDPKPVGER